MKLLLDTHVFLWYSTDDPLLPPLFCVAIRSAENEIWLSIASIWESVIKNMSGKMDFPSPPAARFPQLRIALGIRSLSINDGTMLHLASLPSIHRDPFDRILIAQALQHGLTLVTVDRNILRYPVAVLPVR